MTGFCMLSPCRIKRDYLRIRMYLLPIWQRRILQQHCKDQQEFPNFSSFPLSLLRNSVLRVVSATSFRYVKCAQFPFSILLAYLLKMMLFYVNCWSKVPYITTIMKSFIFFIRMVVIFSEETRSIDVQTRNKSSMNDTIYVVLHVSRLDFNDLITNKRDRHKVPFNLQGLITNAIGKGKFKGLLFIIHSKVFSRQEA